MPRSRNTRIRPKDTSRAEARKRHREEQREVESEDTLDEGTQAEAVAQPATRSAFALPNVVEDVKALPQVFRKPLVWLPFGLLLLAFALQVAFQEDVLPEGPVQDVAVLFLQVMFAFPPLIIFFVGGFVAPRASYIVGGLLGAFYMALASALLLIGSGNLDDTGLTGAAGEQATLEALLPFWGMSITFGIFGGGFAAWYRRFLRSSQERARVNRMQREQEQARKAKEQARADKQAAREARRRA